MRNCLPLRGKLQCGTRRQRGCQLEPRPVDERGSGAPSTGRLGGEQPRLATLPEACQMRLCLGPTRLGPTVPRSDYGPTGL